MRFDILGCEVRISPLFTAAVTALLICDKTGIIPVIILAVLVHECGHIFAMHIVKNPPKRAEFLPFALEITPRSAYSSVTGRIFVSAAGIAANLCLGAVSYFVYRVTGNLWAVAVCSANIAVSLFNLLPLSNLDGGEVLSAVCAGFLSERAVHTIKTVSSVLFLVLLVLFGAYFFIVNKNPTLLIFCLYIGILQPMTGFAEE